jgi:hypothetical protein
MNDAAKVVPVINDVEANYRYTASSIEAPIVKGYQRILEKSDGLFSLNREAKGISWFDVNFQVTKSKKILSSCWGTVPAGHICAVMGPSGAGFNSPISYNNNIRMK